MFSFFKKGSQAKSAAKAREELKKEFLDMFTEEEKGKISNIVDTLVDSLLTGNSGYCDTCIKNKGICSSKYQKKFQELAKSYHND
ncbi:MAG: hypothetical protein PHE32_03630 [Candidatus Shapirobacteria bacterium]|nr:hypothetical protein [Candidatus Shapirobacteria bacterium]MDD4410765.1 hypothetical protein [Candidatus Shapirobacteria bacterium]